MAMDALLRDPTSGIAGKEADLVRSTRAQLLQWMEQRIPELKTARTQYADLSKPFAQMDAGTELLNRVQSALADYGGLAKETAGRYAQALRNADQTARNATGCRGAGMQDTMTPEQLQVMENIARDLARKANAENMGRGVGSARTKSS